MRRSEVFENAGGEFTSVSTFSDGGVFAFRGPPPGRLCDRCRARILRATHSSSKSEHLPREAWSLPLCAPAHVRRFPSDFCGPLNSTNYSYCIKQSNTPKVPLLR